MYDILVLLKGSAMEIIYFAAGFLVAIIAAIINYKLTFSKNTIGTIRIDQSDPEDPPYFFLELKKMPYEFADHTFVICEISTENYISQE